MLPAELVRARRRGERLFLSTIKGTERAEIEGVAAEILETLSTAEGKTFDEVGEELDGVARAARHEKVWAGLKKLALDDCQFGAPLDIDAPSLRAEVFALSSQMRKAATSEEPFSRDEVLRRVADRLAVGPEEVEEGLFSDLKGATRLTRCSKLSREALVERYELAQIQGVLLRAVRVRVVVECSSPDQARGLFQKLKFRQLLFRLEERSEGTYEIELEGPFSLFESVTKYGLQLALLVPALMECKSAEIVADLRWGKERQKLSFETTIAGSEVGDEVPLRSEVRALADAITKNKSPFAAQPARRVFNIPGVGITIPDLCLSAEGRKDVYVEVLGYWSRDAVWKRVEWAEAGAPAPIVFAVSSRLRVSEEVLPSETGAALYVYKGSMSAPALLRQVEELSEPS